MTTLSSRARETVSRARSSETNLLIVLALTIGVLGGLAAVLLDELIVLVRRAGLLLLTLVDFLGPFQIALLPVLGALAVGPLVYRTAVEAKGHGVPEVMEAVALRGGRIRGRVAGVKAVASAITIGSGGSAGREGPIVQISAALGSTIGQRFKMSDQRMRTLVAAGAASGVAASFNAPLAGVFFALEVILQRFTTRGFAVVVLSSISASVVWRSFRGNDPVFEVPLYALESPAELVFYVALGIAAAVVAAAFVTVLYALEDGFDRLSIMGDVKPALGAIPVGLLGAASVLLLGTGNAGINQALRGNLTLAMLLLLLVGKLVATGFTLGSGASGGIFSPSLFMGAMLGGAFGLILNAELPGVVGPPGAYVMTGMAAVFGAAAEAPITSILILFEMTNDYRMMVPLMVATVTATATYSLMKRNSIYTVKLRRKGIDLEQGRARHLLESIPVRRVILRDVPTIALPASLNQAMGAFEPAGSDVLVVLSEGKVVGVARADELREALALGEEQLADVVEADAPVARPDEPLDSALRKMAPRDLVALAVVNDDGVLEGVVTRDALFRAYSLALGEEERDSGPPPG